MDVMWLPLLLAAAGLLASTGFLGLIVFAAERFRRNGKNKPASCSDELPPVTLLKPLCGLEPNLEANLTSFFQQKYPRFEIVFGAREADDPALEVVSLVRRNFPKVPVKIVTTGEPGRANAKVCSLMKMYAAAAYDHFVISDSDVQVAPDYIRQVVRPLLKPEVGLVTCLYRGVPTGGLWSQLEALGMSVEMTSGVLVADLLEGMKFALGPTMATRRDVLQRIGGFGILGDYCADDYVLGAAVYASGKEVVLSDHVIEHVVVNRSLRSSMLHQVRWMKSTRFSRAWGHIGSVLTFAMPFGLLGAVAAIGLHRPRLALVFFIAAWINRVIMSLAAGWITVGDRRCLRYCWLYPVRDLMGFGFWCASFFGRRIVWRGESYRLEHGGLMVLCKAEGFSILAHAEDAGALASPVAVDNLS